MRNAKKTLSLMMIAIFTTFIVLSGIPAGAAVTKAQATATVKAATAAVVKAEASVKATGFNTNTAKKLTATAATATAGVKKLGTAYNPTYLKLVARYQAVNKKIAAVIAAINKVYTDAEQAVTAAEKATDGDLVDLVGDEAALANAQGAVTSALEFIVKLDQNSANYKGLMARIDAANNLIVKAMDEIAANQAAAEKEAADKAAAEAAAKAEADAITAAETAVKAVEVATDAAIALDLGKVAATKVAAVKTAEKVAEYTARLKAVADKFTAATIVSVSAVDGTITVNFNKKPLTTPAAADFKVTKVVTTDAAVTTTVAAVVTVVSDTAVTLAVPAVAATTTAQAVAYSVAYGTATAVPATAYNVAAIPALTPTITSGYSLNQIKVAFNVPVDKTTVAITATAAAADTVKVLDGTTLVDLVANWDADYKGVTLTLGSSFAQEKALSFVLNGVKDAQGRTVTSTTAFVLKDIVSPAVVSATVTTSKTIDVVFSEPISQTSGVAKVWDNITFDGNKAVGTFAVSAANPNKWTLTLNTGLAVGSHVIAISALTDNAGFAIPAFTGTVNVVADTTAPTIASVVVLAKNKLEVVFSEPVDANTGNITVKSVTYNMTAATVVDNKTYDFTLTTPLDAASTYGETITYKAIVDLEGNAVDSTTGKTFTFNAPVDQTKASVTVKLNADNTFTVVFSRLMLADGTASAVDTAANYVLYDKDGKAVAETAVVTPVTAGKEYTVAFATTLGTINPTAYTLKIAAMKDMSIMANATDAVTFAFTAKDTKNPSFTLVPTYKTTNTVVATFDEAMDATTLKTLSNYLYTDASGPTTVLLSSVADASVAVSADNKTVTFTIPGVVAGDSLTFLGVKDAGGAIVDASIFSVAQTIAVTGTFTMADITSVKATAKRTIAIVSTKAFPSVLNPNGFKIEDAAAPSATKYVTAVSVSDDGLTATLTLNADLTADALSGTSPVYVYTYAASGTVADSAITDTLGRKLDLVAAGHEALVADGIKPTVAVATGTVAGTITLTFSEAVTATTAANLLSDLIVRDKDGGLVTLTSGGNLAVSGGTGTITTDYTTITISGLTTGANYTVQLLARNVKDLATPANTVVELPVTSVLAK